MSRTSARSILAALAAAVALVGCSGGDKTTGGCTSDEKCGDPKAFRCDLNTGECFCRTDAACQTGETCNKQGYCQAHIGCYVTSECPSGYFCDASSNSCLVLGRCTSDLHCKFGELCDKTTNTCKPGCHSDGDCNLREACLCDGTDASGNPTQVACVCDATNLDQRDQCAVGTCTPGVCNDDAFCAFGEVCRTPPDGGLKQCVSDYDPALRPYCDSCVYGPGIEACGTGPNFCLYSTYTSSTYCGVDCSQGQDCANGYDCADVIVVWSRTKCSAPSDCSAPDHRTTIPCAQDADCPNHGLCAIDPGMTSGFCYGQCNFHEGASESFCSCVADEDCAQDSCNPSTHICDISKLPCDLYGNGCRTIRCVDFGGQGGCLIGQNCKPLEGLTCADVRQ